MACFYVDYIVCFIGTQYLKTAKCPYCQRRSSSTVRCLVDYLCFVYRVYVIVLWVWLFTTTDRKRSQP